MISTRLFREKISSDEFLNDLPEVKRLKDVFENNGWHHESTFEHTMNVLSEYDNLLADLSVDKDEPAVSNLLNEKIDNSSKANLFYLIFLLHDLGKFETLAVKNNMTEFPGHDNRSFAIAKNIIDKFGVSEKEKEYILKVIKNHSLPHLAFDHASGIQAGFNEIRNNLPDIFLDLTFFAMVDMMGSKLKNKNPEEYNKRLNYYKRELFT